MHKLKTTFLVVGLFLTLIGCSNSRQSSTPLTEDDINNYIRDNKINKIAVEMMNDYAVVLYSEANIEGYHLIYKDDDGNIQDQNFYEGTMTDAPVLIAGSASRNPFVTVLINDDKLLKTASTVEITFEDGTINRKNISGKGAIIPYGKEVKGVMNYSNVVIYDAEMKVLYSYPK
ncbi:hypothetical protein [Cohnella zeiphila]|uniref:Lipoprotein n=1 Tax=Cohnella zeiphila TaxID=2761120 RepID=A0A7X0SK82_9BACL|nr:hypothetical protein [Cohnella zeiphila]MBB6731502.1 hypothetical protein [Cohnella zeiphila]